MDIGERILDIIIDKIQSMYGFEISMIQIKDNEDPFTSSSAEVYFPTPDDCKSEELLLKNIVIYNLNVCKYTNSYYNKYIWVDKKFLKSLNVKNLKLANYCFNILRQLGYIYDYNKHKKNIQAYDEIYKISKAANRLLHDDVNNFNKLLYFSKDLRSLAIADRFAYQHFPMILNLLKENEIEI